MDESRLLFVLSPPRSGSTALQRLIAGSWNVRTIAEPWILLPALYALRPSGLIAEYDHELQFVATSDVISALPGGRTTYLELQRNWALSVYGALAGDDALFLDKTPRYALAIDELLELFPLARMVVLWRNPIHMIDSMIRVDGRWNLHRWRVDLYQGIPNLVRVVERYPERFCITSYEKLTSRPREAFSQLEHLLGESASGPVLHEPLGGRLGDKGPLQDAATWASAKQMDTRWNSLRTKWVRRYLSWLGAERLALMGYDLPLLLEELMTMPTSLGSLVHDLPYASYGVVASRDPRRLGRISLPDSRAPRSIMR